MIISRPSATAALEELVLPLEIAESADVRERQGEAKLIFIAHRAQGKSPIFHADTATIPIVGTLQRTVLQERLVGIEADAGGGADAPLGRPAKPADDAELVEAIRRWNGIGDENLARRVEENVAGSGKIITKMVIQEHRAGVWPRDDGVIVELPGNVHVVRGAYAKTGDDWRKVAQGGEKSEASELRAAGEDIALAVD